MILGRLLARTGPGGIVFVLALLAIAALVPVLNLAVPAGAPLHVPSHVVVLTGKWLARSIPDDVFSLFPDTMLRRRGGDLSGGQQQQLAIGRALVMRPRLLILDEPTEGIQPSIIKDIGRAIRYLKEKGDIAIVLVEQYFEFAKELADRIVVMDRGEVVAAGPAAGLSDADVKRHMSV